MKKNLFNYILIGLVTSCFFACGDKPKATIVEQEEKPLTANQEAEMLYKNRIDNNMARSIGDSITVFTIANEYLTDLKEQRIEAALDKLYENSLGEIIPLTRERRDEMRQLLTSFPCLGFKIGELKLLSNGDNELDYAIRFQEIDGDKDNPANYIRLMLNPVRHQGQWYLTIEPKANNPFFIEGQE